jgi:putative SOS response-associated peptidase YedK
LDLAPTDDAPVVRLDRETGARHLDVLKWAAFAKGRCLVPASVYYEWRDDPEGKTLFAAARLDGEPVVCGGVGNTGSPRMVMN